MRPLTGITVVTLEHAIAAPFATRQLADLGADFLHVRRHEMDHALQPHRQLGVGSGRADRERLEEGAGQFHGERP